MKKIIIITSIILIIGILIYWYLNQSNNQSKIPEKYTNPEYCEIDSDCKYEVETICCNKVVNKYNKDIDLIWNNKMRCNLACLDDNSWSYQCTENKCEHKK